MHLSPQVLDYQNTSHTLLPLVSAAYALTFMGDRMMGMYRQFEKDRCGTAVRLVCSGAVRCSTAVLLHIAARRYAVLDLHHVPIL